MTGELSGMSAGNKKRKRTYTCSNLEGRKHFEDLGTDTRIILKWVLENSCAKRSTPTTLGSDTAGV